jgi:large repetitive protein
MVFCSRGATLDVLANDSDRDGDALTITSVTQPRNASITIAPGGKSLLYTPVNCFVSNTFTYSISDGKGGTAVATVTLIDP